MRPPEEPASLRVLAYLLPYLGAHILWISRDSDPDFHHDEVAEELDRLVDSIETSGLYVAEFSRPPVEVCGRCGVVGCREPALRLDSLVVVPVERILSVAPLPGAYD